MMHEVEKIPLDEINIPQRNLYFQDFNNHMIYKIT